MCVRAVDTGVCVCTYAVNMGVHVYVCMHVCGFSELEPELRLVLAPAAFPCQHP